MTHNPKTYVGNCLDVLKTLPDSSIDLTVTSPPYDKIRDYKGFEIDLPTIGNELYRTTKEGGVVCVIIQDGTKEFAKSLTTARLTVDWVDRVGFKLFETVIYSRDGRPGAWWSKRFRVDHEYILIFFKGDRPKYFCKEHLKIPAKHAGEIWHGTQRHTDGSVSKIKKTIQSDKKCRGTIWKYDSSKSEHNKLKNLHPAPFPDKLAEDLILTFSKPDEIVLDPFVGSGTTLVMSKKNFRNSIGIDISQEYIDLSNKRLNL